MDRYITGSMIKRIREEKHMTQEELARKLCVSDKAVSKWETGRGYPDVALIEPLAAALGVSVVELLSGSSVSNTNRSFQMKRSKFYVCPICGNILVSAGEAVVSCCGIILPPAEAEPAEGEHEILLEPVEDEYYVTMHHPMEKQHFISFFAAVSDDGVELHKCYPEGPAEARFRRRQVSGLYGYCNRHGLFRMDLRAGRIKNAYRFNSAKEFFHSVR